MKSLPLGWKQKLAFSVAASTTEDRILDEPTGEWTAMRRQFWEMMRCGREGITVFVTTHYMDEAEYCDQASIMVDSRIGALDTPRAAKNPSCGLDGRCLPNWPTGEKSGVGAEAGEEKVREK